MLQSWIRFKEMPIRKGISTIILRHHDSFGSPSCARGEIIWASLVRWIYPFERYMKVLKGYVRNRNKPEGCIAECYIAEEAVEFCADYLSNVNTIGIPRSNVEACETKAMTSVECKTISIEEWEQAHLYVLTNDIEMDPFIKYVLKI